MSRRNAAAKKLSHAQALAAVYDEQPTKPLPTVTLFDLIAETRRMDAASDSHDGDADRTLTIDAEQNKRLVAKVLAGDVDLDLAPPPVAHPSDDDAPTLYDRSPLRALPSIELAPSPPPVDEKASGVRARVTPEQVREARRGTWLPSNTAENWIVAGIWAMALSLIVVLMILAT